MSVLFLLSNTAVPFLILSYTSLVKAYQNGEFMSAKWLILVLYTFLSNLLHYFFFEESKIFLLLDLIVKLGIVFIPHVVNQSLEKVIATFHLQILITLFRAFWMQQFFILYCLVTGFLYKFMHEDEKKIFKQSLLQILDQEQRKYITPNSNRQYAKVYKSFENIGVNCDILNMGLLNEEIRQKQFLKFQLSQKKIQSNITQATHQSGIGHEVVSSRIKQSRQRHTRVEQENDHDIYSMKKKGYAIHRSGTDIEIVQQEQKVAITTLRKNDRKSDNITPTHMKKHSTPHSKIEEKPKSLKEVDEPSMILNKLDVSEYSDMFQDDEEEDHNGRKLLARVETIIQIGGSSSARLEIYNIELYSTSQIRIVSLYGRQFQKHKLISMRPLNHGYYELKLEGGKVDSRKVKFRGPFEPFQRYLISDK